jgi:hypothetical protein
MTTQKIKKDMKSDELIVTWERRRRQRILAREKKKMRKRPENREIKGREEARTL